MALEAPTTLSPSKVSTFTSCALAFRFSAIDRVPEPPSAPAVKGTLVHTSLEALFELPAAERTRAAAGDCLDRALADLRLHPDYEGLGLDAAAETAFVNEASRLVDNYFALEDPGAINPVGLELRLRAEVGDLGLVGIIDRLELDADGELVVTDYKTGRAPDQRHEQARLGGVHFYSLLCEEFFGRRPARVQLLHLAEPVAITAVPTDRSTGGLRRKIGAIWSAVERACEHEDFRPKPGPLCSWCSFQEWCPSFGGDPDQAPRPADQPVAIAS